MLLLAACGKSDIAGLDDPEAPGSAPPEALTHAVDGFTVKASTDSLIYGGDLEQVSLTTTETPETVTVEVKVDGAHNLKALYFDLDYDPALYTPVATEATHGLDPADVLQLGLLAEAGTVHCGQVLVHPDQQHGLSGDLTLARVEFERRPFSGTRIISAAPILKGSRTRVDYNLKLNILRWRYANQGDYDQNSEVNVSDLTPLAVRFGHAASGTPQFPSDSIDFVVDGDANGIINVSDLTAIGANFRRRVTKYNIYQGAESDIPKGNADLSTIPPIGSLDFTARTGDPGKVPLQFVFSPPNLDPNAIYWVRPADGNAEGTPSAPDGDIIALKDEAVPLGPDTGIEFLGKIDDDTYQFRDPPGGRDLKVGDVVFGAFEDIIGGTFMGILVKVKVIVSRAGDIVTVDIERAGITDVLKDGAINGVTGMTNTTTTDTSIRKPCSIDPDSPLLHRRTVRMASDAPHPDPMRVSPEEFQQRFRLITADYLRAQAAQPTRSASDFDIGLPLEGLTFPLPGWAGPGFKVVVDKGTFQWHTPIVESYIDVNTQHVDAVIIPGIHTPPVLDPFTGAVIIPGIDTPDTVVTPAFDFPTALGDFGASVEGAIDFDIEAHAMGTIGAPPPGAPPIEYKFASIHDTFVFLAGGIPVEITTSLNAYIGIEVKPDVDFYARAGMHMDYAMEMGIDYDAAGVGGVAGTFTPSFSDDFNFTPSRPELRLDGHGNIFVYLKGEVRIALYEDVPGANAGIAFSLSPGLNMTLDGNLGGAGDYCVNYDLFGRLKGDVELFWEPLGGNINVLKAIFGSDFNPIPGVSAEFPIFDIDTPLFTDGRIGCDGGAPPIVYLGRKSGGNGPLPVTVTYDAVGVKDDHTDLPGVDYTIDPDGGAMKRFFWDLDGDTDCEQDTGAVGMASHTYDAYGDYVVSVWVVDDDGMLTHETFLQTIAP
jgi:hypothetical protein